MNAGIVFGFRHEKEIPEYFNVLISGSDVLIERNGLGPNGRLTAQHLTPAYSLRIESGKSYNFRIEVAMEKIEVFVGDNRAAIMDRLPGVVGRVGLRPWRRQLDCREFTVAAR